MADYNKAIELKSDASVLFAYNNRAWARFAKGDITGALEDCKCCVKFKEVDTSLFFPNGSVKLFHICESEGMIAFINGDYPKAVVSWEKALQFNPVAKPSLQPWIEKAKAKQITNQ